MSPVLHKRRKNQNYLGRLRLKHFNLCFRDTQSSGCGRRRRPRDRKVSLQTHQHRVAEKQQQHQRSVHVAPHRTAALSLRPPAGAASVAELSSLTDINRAFSSASLEGGKIEREREKNKTFLSQKINMQNIHLVLTLLLLIYLSTFAKHKPFNRQKPICKQRF